MRKILSSLVLLATACLLGSAQTPLEAKFPCQFVDFRIAKNDTVLIYVYCLGATISSEPRPPGQTTSDLMAKERNIWDFKAEGTLYKLKDESVVYPHVQITAAKVDANNPFWLTFAFAQPLESSQDYELRLAGTYSLYKPNNVGIEEKKDFSFKGERFRFSTRPDLAAAKIKGQNAQGLFGHVALKLSPSAKLIDQANNKEYSLEHAALSRDTSSPNPDEYDALGYIHLKDSTGAFPVSFGQNPPRLSVQGVTDIFGQTPTVKAAKAAPPPVAPKNRDAASWYLNFLHQAGVGIAPTWIANIKVAPVLGHLPMKFFITPSLDVDVGQGQVGSTKTNDLINPKIGVSRMFWTRVGYLEAIEFMPAYSYQTSRRGDHRSSSFDGSWRLFFKGIENTKAERSQDAYQRARLENPNLRPDDVPKAHFGYSIQLFLGTQIGAALTDSIVKSSDKSSQVTVPAYAIRQFRPHVSATFELWNLTVSTSVDPRYLFVDENVTREIDTVQASGKVTKTVLLSTVSGWRPYTEVSLNYAFDPAGHFALNVVFKVGSIPTNYNHTNSVQSGILVRF